MVISIVFCCSLSFHIAANVAHNLCSRREIKTNSNNNNKNNAWKKTENHTLYKTCMRVVVWLQ